MPDHRPAVADAMLTTPALSGAGATTGDVRRLLAGEHRHVALVVDPSGVLLTVVSSDDLPADGEDGLARDLGRLRERVVAPHADLDSTRVTMLDTGRRRLAVVDDTGRLLGLLCLKSHGRGFCTAETVAERAEGG